MKTSLLICAIFAALTTVRVDAAVRTFMTAGNWSTATNWQNAQKPGNGDDVVIAANCTVDENIGVYSFASLSVNTNINLFLKQYALVFSGAVANSGFIYTENTSATPLPSGKTWGSYVFFSAAGAQTVPAGTYHSLKTEATGATRTVAAGGDISVSHELYVEGFTNVNQSVFDLGVYRLSGKPDWTWVSGKLRTANTSPTPLPSGMRWYSNLPMRQGAVEFYATTAQYLPGGTYDDDLILSASTKTLTGVLNSNGILTLSGAILSIGDSNAIIGTTGSIITTSAGFSANDMIATTGAGMLIRRFSAAGAYTYPLGDLTGTAEYSPAVLQFTNISGTYGAGVRVANAKHPQNTSQASYINRYWAVDVLSTSVGIGSAQFKYTDADIVGPEDNMHTGQWIASQWFKRNKADTAANLLSATGVQLGGDFTGYSAGAATACIVDAKIFLQGPWSGPAGGMSVSLGSGCLLPLSQPYNTQPWNYAGAESVGSIPANTIVDWLLLELRTTPGGTSAARRAAFLHANGRITDLNGSSPVSFPALTPGPYYLVIRHRNHLAVMSSDTIRIDAATPLYDFTTAQAQAYGTEPMTGLSAGQAPFGMWSGDANADGQLKYTGAGNDPSFILLRLGSGDITATAAGYHREDTGMNGVTQYSGAGNDRAVILRNIGGVNTGNTRNTQVP